MARLNDKTTRTRGGTGALTTSTAPTTTTFEGAPAFQPDARAELFTLATNDFAGERTFYETAEVRRARLSALIANVTRTHPRWMLDFLTWLRVGGNMRTVAIVAGIEAGRTRSAILCYCGRTATHAHGDRGVTCAAHFEADGVELPGARWYVDAVLQRADEPGEALAYWTSTYSRAIPKWLRRGIGTAALRLWTERAYLKWDSDARSWRMADVLELCHPNDANAGAQRMRAFQAALFAWMITDRHDRRDDDGKRLAPPESLPMLREAWALNRLPADKRRAVLDTPERFEAAGFTWENLGAWLPGGWDARAWEAIIPSMGVMGLLRNLRNFDQHGVSDHVADAVAARLLDVERGRLLPFQVFSAYLAAADSDRWRYPLTNMFDACTRNVPKVPGSTLVAVDVSASMGNTMSDRSVMRRIDAAAVFAAAWVKRNGGDVVCFGSRAEAVPMIVTGSAMRSAETIRAVFTSQRCGHSTNIAHAVRENYNGHKRVIVLTDDQSHDGNAGDWFPQTVPGYTYDLGGYGRSAMGTGANRHLLGGLTDATFAEIERVEAGRSGSWPWEAQA